MDDRSAGQTRPSIFVSLRYGSGDLIEKALSKVLVRESYSVFLHVQTADALARASSQYQKFHDSLKRYVSTLM